MQYASAMTSNPKTRTPSHETGCLASFGLRLQASAYCELFLARVIVFRLHQHVERLRNLQIDLRLARNQRAPIRAGPTNIARQFRSVRVVSGSDDLEWRCLV